MFQVCYRMILCLLIKSKTASLVSAVVYGFQNNLAPTSGSVLTTSGANVNANVGGTPAYSLTCFHNVYTVKYFFFSVLCIFVYIYRLWCSEERAKRWWCRQHWNLFKSVHNPYLIIKESLPGKTIVKVK